MLESGQVYDLAEDQDCKGLNMVYKILLAEDEPTMRRLMTMLLKRQGHDVIEAENGETVVDLAQEHQPDLLLLDIMMPVVDGYEALRRVRSTPGIQDIPVIFLSAKSQVEDRVEGLKLGADDYLTKPADPDELMARIVSVMTRSMREARRRKGKIFGFVGAKGGVGTTTALVNLGLLFQRAGKSTMLVDMHLAFGNMAGLLGLSADQRTTAGLTTIPAAEVNLESIEQNLLNHPSGLRVLAGPPTVPMGISFSAEHLSAMVEQAAFCSQIVLLDFPQDPDIIEVVSELIDGIILVVGSEPAALQSARNISHHLGRIGLHNRMSTMIIHRQQSSFQYVTGNNLSEALGCLYLGAISAKPELYLQAEQERAPLMLNGKGQSEQSIYQGIGEKLINYVDIMDQFRANQTLNSRNLA